jgi:hypothetical protein
VKKERLIVTAGSEFDPWTGGPKMDINWSFGIYPVYVERKGLKLGFYSW